MMPAMLVLVSTSTIMAGEYEASSEDLEHLLSDYKRYGIPLPPKDVRLVRINYGVGTRFQGVTSEPSYVYGFAEGDLGTSSRNRVIVGLSHVELDNPVEHADGNAFNADLISRRTHLWELGNLPLVAAIQCHSRGYSDLGKAIIRRSVSSPSYRRYVDRQVLEELRTVPLRSMLAATAADYWYRLIRSPDSDWRTIERNLGVVDGSDHNLNKKATSSALKSLRSSLAPRKTKPGSVEAMVDDLVEMRQEFGTLVLDEVTAPEYLRLLEKGFDAVPALIEHLEDERMTRAVMVGFNNFPTYSMRLNQLAYEILCDIAAQDLQVNWLRRQQGYTARREVAQSWWEEARKTGEREWMLGHLVEDTGGESTIARGPIRVLARRYPADFSRAVEALAETGPQWGWNEVAAAIVESGLDSGGKESLIRRLEATPEASSYAREALYLLSLVSEDLKYDGKPPCCISLPVSSDSPLLERARRAMTITSGR